MLTSESRRLERAEMLTSAVFREFPSGEPLSQTHWGPVEAGNAALYRGFSHGLCHLFVHLSVEGFGDQF